MQNKRKHCSLILKNWKFKDDSFSNQAFNTFLLAIITVKLKKRKQVPETTLLGISLLKKQKKNKQIIIKKAI